MSSLSELDEEFIAELVNNLQDAFDNLDLQCPHESREWRKADSHIKTAAHELMSQFRHLPGVHGTKYLAK
jgi:replication fork clamp-binding protein CrfC